MVHPLYPRDITVDVFMDSIRGLVSDPPPKMLISVKGDYLDKEIFSTLSDYVQRDVKKISAEGIAFVEKLIANESTLRVMLEDGPAEFSRGLRIDYRGQIVFCADQAQNIDRPVGNILEDPDEILSRIELIKQIRSEYALLK